MGKFFPRETDHFCRGVNAGNEAARHGAGDFGGDFAVAATNIENVFVTAQLELGDEFARPGLLHGGIRGVIGGIPSGG